MSRARPNDVFKEVERFTWFQRLLGVFSLVHSNGELKISRKWLTISLINLIGNLVIFIYTLQLTGSIFNISNWYCYLKTAYSVASFFCIVASWIQNNRKLNLLNSSLSKMRAVDLQMLSLGKELPPTKPSWTTSSMYTLMIVAFILRVLAVPTFFGRFQIFLIYAPYVVIVSIEDIVDRIDSLILLRFNAITKYLLQCSGMGAKKVVIVLEKLILCHDLLSSSSEDIDEYFSIQVMSVLAVFFLASFCELYASSIIYRDDTLSYKELLLIEKFIWLIIMIMVISRICHQFSSITTESEEFDMLLYRIMIDDKTNAFLNNSKLQLHIAMNRQVVFTAHGFIRLDYSLLHSMIASSLTYLVIVLQFNQQTPSLDFNEATSEVSTTAVPFFPTTTV
ncbi:Gustatory receptor 138 [Halyomorpha halys]|nr:Gustatory receptor 138 [Halyomorpha halys]